MNYSRLLADRKIRAEPGVRTQVQAQIAGARRDIETAKRFGSDEQWTYNIAYNAMLLAGRAVMFSEGYRPTTGEGGHAAVIDFLRIKLDASFGPLLDIMDRMRRQRHRITYEGEPAVSRAQITEAIQTAEKFVGMIEAILRPPKGSRPNTPGT